jgi:hypothetical protein
MTDFPVNLDNLSNPGATTDLLNSNPALGHAKQHTDANDAIEALETKIGIDDSTDPDSLDYKIKHGGAARQTTQATTDALAADASDAAKTIALGKGGIAIKISTDYPAWVRVYSSTDAQTADATRLITVDPTSGSGVLLEVLTATGALEIILSPTAVLFSEDGTVNLPLTVTNKDTVSRTITVIITTVPIEG